MRGNRYWSTSSAKMSILVISSDSNFTGGQKGMVWACMNVDGHPSRGRPKKRWMDCVMDDMKIK
jgi:hypothetical protein